MRSARRLFISDSKSPRRVRVGPGTPRHSKRPIITMNSRSRSCVWGALQRQILDNTGQLEALAQGKGRAHHTPHAETG